MAGILGIRGLFLSKSPLPVSTDPMKVLGLQRKVLLSLLKLHLQGVYVSIYTSLRQKSLGHFIIVLKYMQAERIMNCWFIQFHLYSFKNPFFLLEKKSVLIYKHPGALVIKMASK